MYSIKAKLIRFLANTVLFFRGSSLTNGSVKWVVFSGSVGKTIARRGLYDSVKDADIDVFTLKTNYCNELGVILSLLQIEIFNPWSGRSWWQLFFKQPVTDGYVLIELGADFRLDIDWFLRYWTPDTVVLTLGTDTDWTTVVSDVLASRMRLCTTATKVYVSSHDVVHIHWLDKYRINCCVLEHEIGVYTYLEPVLLQWLADNQLMACKPRIFSLSRFHVQVLPQGTRLIEDTYKVTPVCFAYVVKTLLTDAKATTVLVCTEIRPLLIEPRELYKNVLPLLQKLDQIYFTGDEGVCQELIKNVSNIQYIPVLDVPNLVDKLKEQCEKGEIDLGIKVSSHYELGL